MCLQGTTLNLPPNPHPADRSSLPPQRLLGSGSPVELYAFFHLLLMFQLSGLTKPLLTLRWKGSRKLLHNNLSSCVFSSIVVIKAWHFRQDIIFPKDLKKAPQVIPLSMAEELTWWLRALAAQGDVRSITHNHHRNHAMPMNVYNPSPEKNWTRRMIGCHSPRSVISIKSGPPMSSSGLKHVPKQISAHIPCGFVCMHTHTYTCTKFKTKILSFGVLKKCGRQFDKIRD